MAGYGSATLVRRALAVLVPAVVTVALAPAAHATPGHLDSSFGAGGIATVSSPFADFVARDAAIQVDGKIVVAGSLGHGGLVTARLNTDGSPDQSFGGGFFGAGIVVEEQLGGTAGGVAIQPDGKIVVAGEVGDLGDVFVVRYNPDGTPDITFGSQGTVRTDTRGSFAPAGVVVQPDGKIVVAGTDSLFELNGDDFILLRYTPFGTLDPFFGACADDPSGLPLPVPPPCATRSGIVLTDFARTSDDATGVVLQPDGKVVVVGGRSRSSPFLARDFAVARYNADGTLDERFGEAGRVTTDLARGGHDGANDVALDAQGRIVAAGSSERIGDNPGRDFALTRYLSDGALDAGFGHRGIVTTDLGSDAEDFANDVAVASDGSVLAAGGTFVDGCGCAFALVRYDGDGRRDHTFANDGRVVTSVSDDAPASSVTLQADGRIVVTGGFRLITVARYLP